MTTWTTATSLRLGAITIRQLGAEGRYSEAIVEWDCLIEFHTGRDEISLADALAWKCWCLDRCSCWWGLRVVVRCGILRGHVQS